MLFLLIHYLLISKTNGDDFIEIDLETLINLHKTNNFYFTEKSFKYCFDKMDLNKLRFIKDKLVNFNKFYYIDSSVEDGNTTMVLFLFHHFNIKPSQISKRIAQIRNHQETLEIVNQIGVRN
jgi:hypothetical protein